MKTGMGGEGTRTSAAMHPHGGVGCGGGWLRRTFAVGRLTRRTAEIQVARDDSRRALYTLKATVRARACPGAATVH